MLNTFLFSKLIKTDVKDNFYEVKYYLCELNNTYYASINNYIVFYWNNLAQKWQDIYIGSYINVSRVRNILRDIVWNKNTPDVFEIKKARIKICLINEEKEKRKKSYLVS